MSKSKKISPSDFMRNLRPELYSDSGGKTIFELDAPTLEYHLSTITERSEMYKFEIFCRKLCERTICPNLRPATGPEGGGDSKVDTETIPVANEIASLEYIGVPGPGKEQWAFAFSAKKEWKQKAQQDIEKIINTNREYKNIYFVTSQFASSKFRAEIEDSLTSKHKTKIIILDRSWIVSEIIEKDRKDLAYNYLDVGKEIEATAHIGPIDYSRKHQLKIIENSLKDPEFYVGMKRQRAVEALLAAKISRSLELPQSETTGRFIRAIQFAEVDGTYSQQVEAQYEWLWTSFWWFDDYISLNQQYDDFQRLVCQSDSVKNLELLCNLNVLLFIIAKQGWLPKSKIKLTERTQKLEQSLAELSSDSRRPNGALEAKTSLLLVKIVKEICTKKKYNLSSLWEQFFEIIDQAAGLGEFSAARLANSIEKLGQLVPNDQKYAELIDKLSKFVAKRTSEAEGALILLTRAKQLKHDDWEIIRLLGKSTHQLAKKEYRGSFIEANRLLTLAYYNTGLLWVARSNCFTAITSINIDDEESNTLSAEVISMYVRLAFIAIELQHIPDFLNAMHCIRTYVAEIPLDDNSQNYVKKMFEELDLAYASLLLNFSNTELNAIDKLPDVLSKLELYDSYSALMYILGYEQELRAEGNIPTNEKPEKVRNFYQLLADQTELEKINMKPIFNISDNQILSTKVLGVQIDIAHQANETSILIAEIFIGSIEVIFATLIKSQVYGHVEHFKISVEISESNCSPCFSIDEKEMSAFLSWPKKIDPTSYEWQIETLKIMQAASFKILIATCMSRNFEVILNNLFAEENLQFRLPTVITSLNSYHRSHGKYISRITDWTEMSEKKFSRRKNFPKLHDSHTRQSSTDSKREPEISLSHKSINVQSIINVHLWNSAEWKGAAFLTSPESTSAPTLALLFAHQEPAVKIFDDWHVKFGPTDDKEEIYVAIVREIFTNKPDYRILISSKPKLNAHLISIPARIQTMQPKSRENLDRFIEDFYNKGSYFLTPMILDENNVLQNIPSYKILKKQLNIKKASEIDENDFEQIAISVP